MPAARTGKNPKGIIFCWVGVVRGVCKSGAFGDRGGLAEILSGDKGGMGELPKSGTAPFLDLFCRPPPANHCLTCEL
jgi:hypothetical protein